MSLGLPGQPRSFPHLLTGLVAVYGTPYREFRCALALLGFLRLCELTRLRRYSHTGHRRSSGTVDLTAARTHGIIDALISQENMTFADEASQGVGGSIRTRTNVMATARNSPPGRSRSTAPMPGSGPSAKAPTPPSNLESPDQAAPQPAPSHPDRASHPRSPSRREFDPPRMKGSLSARGNRPRRTRRLRRRQRSGWHYVLGRLRPDRNPATPVPSDRRRRHGTAWARSRPLAGRPC